MAGRLAGRLVSILAAAASVGAAVLAPPPAEAQMRMGMGMGGDMLAPAVSTRELEKIGTMLSLTAEQKEAAKALLSAYQDEHGKAAKAMQDALKNAQSEFAESQDPSVFTKDLPDEMRKHQDKMKSLETGFMNDLKSLLDGKQAELWPRVERGHRREKSLPNGMLAGESVNLGSIVDDLNLEGKPSRELDQAIEAYEIDLDRAMTERDAKREEMQKKQEEGMKDFDFTKIDFDQIRKMMQDYRSSGLKVRDVNERHARLIAGALPEARQAEFTDRVRKATFPQVYKAPYPTKAMKAASEFGDLTSEQKQAISEMLASYQREVATANEAWSNAIATEEKEGGGDPFGGFGRMMPGGSNESSAVDTARKARRELDKSTISKLKALLTEDQQAKLPEKENDNPWGMNLGGGGGREEGDEGKPSSPRRDRKRD
ncbi:MAG: hypothetical protein IT438_09470 [Phycisphaerales bacterium]|nr:hypothetical protein [Phycisphaerales bacterium]